MPNYALHVRSRKRENPNKKAVRVWSFLIFSILIVVIDRILKFVIFKNFHIGSSFPVIKDILYITPTYNKGVAFGLFKESAPFILVVLPVIAACFILYIILMKRPESLLLKSGLFLVLAGAIGNLIDRIICGYVLDFIDVRIWPVFNMADSSITVGAGLILWYLFKMRR